MAELSYILRARSLGPGRTPYNRDPIIPFVRAIPELEGSVHYATESLQDQIWS